MNGNLDEFGMFKRLHMDMTYILTFDVIKMIYAHQTHPLMSSILFGLPVFFFSTDGCVSAAGETPSEALRRALGCDLSG